MAMRNDVKGTDGTGEGFDPTGGNGKADTATEAERREGGQGPDRRQSRADRRTGLDRRQQSAAEAGYTGPERRKNDRRDTGLERRRGPGRRRSDERKSAEEGEMDTAQFELVMAIETYKKVNRRMYPTWTEILEVVRQLGYRKVKPRDITLANVPEPELYTGADPVAPEFADDEDEFEDEK
jgi:hypothetical protein